MRTANLFWLKGVYFSVSLISLPSSHVLFCSTVNGNGLFYLTKEQNGNKGWFIYVYKRVHLRRLCYRYFLFKPTRFPFSATNDYKYSPSDSLLTTLSHFRVIKRCLIQTKARYNRNALSSWWRSVPVDLVLLIDSVWSHQGEVKVVAHWKIWTHGICT